MENNLSSIKLEPYWLNKSRIWENKNGENSKFKIIDRDFVRLYMNIDPHILAVYAIKLYYFPNQEGLKSIKKIKKQVICKSKLNHINANIKLGFKNFLQRE